MDDKNTTERDAAIVRTNTNWGRKVAATFMPTRNNVLNLESSHPALSPAEVEAREWRKRALIAESRIKAAMEIVKDNLIVKIGAPDMATDLSTIKLNALAKLLSEK